ITGIIGPDHIVSVGPDGAKLWSSALLASGFGAIGANGDIYTMASLTNGGEIKLVSVHHEDGKLDWSFSLPLSWDTGAPTAGPDGTVYVAGSDGSVTAVRPDGTLRWSFPVATATTVKVIDSPVPALASDGTVYVGSELGVLYAIRPDGTKKWDLQVSSSK